MEYFLEFLLTFCAVVVTLVFTVSKVILPKMIDGRIEQLKQSYNRETKIIEKNYESELEKLKIAAEFAYRSHEELRSKRIVSVEKLWNEIARLNRAFAPLLAVEFTLTEQEFNELFRKNGSEIEELNKVINNFSSFKNVVQIINNNRSDDTQLTFVLGDLSRVQVESRIFVTGELWKIYEAFIRVYGRFGFLVSTVATSNSEVNWRTDKLMKRAIEEIISADVWTKIQDDKLPLHSIIVLLQMEFISEAQNVFRSLDVFSETTQEFHSMLECVDADVSNIRKTYPSLFE